MYSNFKETVTTLYVSSVDKPVICRCGCRGFIFVNDLFHCINCWAMFSTKQDDVSYSVGNEIPKEALELGDSVNKLRTHSILRDGSMGSGWYLADTNSLEIAIQLVEEGWAKND